MNLARKLPGLELVQTKRHVYTPITIDGRTVLASRMTAGIIKRCQMDGGIVTLRRIEEFLQGVTPPDPTNRLLDTRHQNTIKAISRARRYLTDNFGERAWLRVFTGRNGRKMVEL